MRTNTAYLCNESTNFCEIKVILDEIGIDRIDLKLLGLLQKNALASTEALGDAAGLSATAAKRRVNRLRRDGYLRKEVALLDPQRLGFGVFTLVFVNLERDRRDIVQNFKQAIGKHPRILQAFYTTGDSDFVLLVVSRTLADYEEFTQSFFWENANIKNFQTMVVMENVKLGFELPIDD
jgi:Lrp/AsnC family leucine-responsive transcriptional regulator